MRCFCFLLSILALTTVEAQTAHIKGDSIYYEGRVQLGSGTGSGLSESGLRTALLDAVRELNWEDLSGADTAVLQLRKQLPAPGRAQRAYLLLDWNLRPASGSVRYGIGNIRVLREAKGEKPDTLTAEMLIDGLEESGNSAITAERTLNYIDMRIQALLGSWRRRIGAARVSSGKSTR